MSDMSHATQLLEQLCVLMHKVCEIYDNACRQGVLWTCKEIQHAGFHRSPCCHGITPYVFQSSNKLQAVYKIPAYLCCKQAFQMAFCPGNNVMLCCAG